MDICSSRAGGINCYALVAYIPDPLGSFLDELRRDLVPGCNPHAHVTLLPPRPIEGSPTEAWRHIHDFMEGLPAFDVQALGISVFPVTNVIYIELDKGKQRLVELHHMLNHGAVNFKEPYPYHPHITLAQDLPPDRIGAVLEKALRGWASYRNPRTFPVKEVTFVQNTADNCWLDLASVQLDVEPIPALFR